MAYFAEIDEQNTVIRVLAVPDEEQHRGQSFLADDLKLGGIWIETSYNDEFRKQFASPGFSFDPHANVFIRPQPYSSWVLNDNHDWQPPVPYPTEGGQWTWNETNKEWLAVD